METCCFGMSFKKKNSQTGIKGFTWFVKWLSCAHMPLYCNCFVTESKLNYEVPIDSHPSVYVTQTKDEGKHVVWRTLRMNKKFVTTSGWNWTRHPLRKRFGHILRCIFKGIWVGVSFCIMSYGVMWCPVFLKTGSVCNRKIKLLYWKNE